MNKMNKMRKVIEERNLTTKRSIDMLLESKFIEEITRLDTKAFIKDFLKDNPVELLKSFYLLQYSRFIARYNSNGYYIESLNMDDLHDFLSEEIVSVISDFQEGINDLDHYRYNNLAIMIMEESYDFGLLVNIYENDVEFFDEWIYGDTYRRTKYTNLESFTYLIAEIIEEIGVIKIEESLNEIYSLCS